jgi:hypothetical protein
MGLFQRFARTVESAEPGIVDGPAEDADREPAPAYYAEDHPKAGLWERPLTTAPVQVERHCPGCTGLTRTVRQLQDERRQLRAQLARHELAATRGQRLRPSEQLP